MITGAGLRLRVVVKGKRESGAFISCSGVVAMSKTRQLTEDQLKTWLGELGINVTLNDGEDFHDGLRDGVILCQLVNHVKPGSVDEVRELIAT